MKKLTKAQTIRALSRVRFLKKNGVQWPAESDVHVVGGKRYT